MGFAQSVYMMARQHALISDACVGVGGLCCSRRPHGAAHHPDLAAARRVQLEGVL